MVNPFDAMARILVVEDDELMRKMIRTALVKFGHIVIEAREGREAVRLFRGETPDLVLTDIIMPDQEGLETVVALRRILPDVKIIAMSGGGRGSAQDYLLLARQLGAKAALSKPFATETLLKTVDEVLRSAGS